jgi:hypothetical protein
MLAVRRLAVAAILAAALPTTGCRRKATLVECETLLDRYVVLLVRQETPGATEDQVAIEQAKTRAKARTDESFTSCPGEVTASELSCAMAAPNVDEFEKCLE